MKKSALITGSCGLIGSEVSGYLAPGTFRFSASITTSRRSSSDRKVSGIIPPRRLPEGIVTAQTAASHWKLFT
jgi:hypothetical protein